MPSLSLKSRLRNSSQAPHDLLIPTAMLSSHAANRRNWQAFRREDKQAKGAAYFLPIYHRRSPSTSWAKELGDFTIAWSHDGQKHIIRGERESSLEAAIGGTKAVAVSMTAHGRLNGSISWSFGTEEVEPQSCRADGCPDARRGE